MDSADEVKRALSHQGQRLGFYEQNLKEGQVRMENFQDSMVTMTAQIAQLAQAVQTLTESAALSPRSMASSSPQKDATIPEQVSASGQNDVTLCTPRCFDGDPEVCRGFLRQCNNVFRHQSRGYDSDLVRVAYVTNLMTGRALEWANAIQESEAEEIYSYEDFTRALLEVFDHPSRDEESDTRMFRLRQGSRSVADYSIDFRTVAATSGWNARSLRGAFKEGLSESMKDELATLDIPDSLDGLVRLAICLDNRGRERRRARGERWDSSSQHASPPRPRTTQPGPERRGERRDYSSQPASPPRPRTTQPGPERRGEHRDYSSQPASPPRPWTAQPGTEREGDRGWRSAHQRQRSTASDCSEPMQLGHYRVSDQRYPRRAKEDERPNAARRATASVEPRLAFRRRAFDPPLTSVRGSRRKQRAQRHEQSEDEEDSIRIGILSVSPSASLPDRSGRRGRRVQVATDVPDAPARRTVRSRPAPMTSPPALVRSSPHHLGLHPLPESPPPGSHTPETLPPSAHPPETTHSQIHPPESRPPPPESPPPFPMTPPPVGHIPWAPLSGAPPPVPWVLGHGLHNLCLQLLSSLQWLNMHLLPQTLASSRPAESQ